LAARKKTIPKKRNPKRKKSNKASSSKRKTTSVSKRRTSSYKSRSKTRPASRSRPATKSKKVKKAEKELTEVHGPAIARIMGQAQYRINESTVSELNRIDNEIVTLIQGDDITSTTTSGRVKEDHETINSKLQQLLSVMISLIENNGKEVSSDEIIPSDFIVPPSDISIEDASDMFKGEGLIPG